MVYGTLAAFQFELIKICYYYDWKVGEERKPKFKFCNERKANIADKICIKDEVEV